jgi:hypothetical protein
MMARIDMTGIREAKRFVDVIGKSDRFITSHMISQLLPKSRKFIGAQAKAKLKDGATNFVAKSHLRFKRPLIKKDNMGSLFWDKEAYFMEEVIRGGTKRARNRRIPEPNTKNFRLDKQGNIPQNFQQQVSVRSGTAPKSVQRAKLRAKYKRKSGKSIIPSGSDRRFNNIFFQKEPINSQLPAGIYRRDRRGKLKLLIGYKRQNREQRQIWDAGSQALKYVQNNINNQFRRSFVYWQGRELKYQMRKMNRV